MPASSDPTSFSYGTPAGPDTGDLTGATSTNSLGGIFNSGSTSALQTLSIVVTNILSDNKKIAYSNEEKNGTSLKLYMDRKKYS